MHRDIKPSNVFLTADGAVKILDFGLAKVDDDPRPDHTPDASTLTIQTDPGAILGTAGYMSPEQIRGQATDARSDIFSLSCVLYEMVAGTGPFAGLGIVGQIIARAERTTGAGEHDDMDVRVIIRGGDRICQRLRQGVVDGVQNVRAVQRDPADPTIAFKKDRGHSVFSTSWKHFSALPLKHH